MSNGYKVIITGEHELPDLTAPLFHNSLPVQWKQVPVLKFERITVDAAQLESIQYSRFDWIIFTSPRAVQFWNEFLLENGLEVSAETKIACIGETTAETAGNDGYNADFYPSSPGSECFLREFKELLEMQPKTNLRILIPQAVGGRTLLRDGLTEMGCEVVTLPLYQSVPRSDVEQFLSDEEVKTSSLVLFTSPSSCEAFLEHFDLPEGTPVGAIGKFTFQHLVEKGFKPKLLPEGDFANVGEILC